MMAYWEQGPADLSVNAICALAGVAKPSVYREFGSEDGLQRAALDHYAQTVLADVLAIFEQGGGGLQFLPRLIDFACGDARFDCGCLFFKMRAAKPRLGPLTAVMLDNIQTQALAVIARTLAQASSGRRGQDAEFAARYIFEQLGLAMSLRALGLPPESCRAIMQLAFAPLQDD